MSAHLEPSFPSRKARLARQRILEWIEANPIDVGERLPSERTLAHVLALNHHAVRQGLAELAERGIVETRARSGNYLLQHARTSRTVRIAIIPPSYLVDHMAWPALAMEGVTSVLDPVRYMVSCFYYQPDDPRTLERALARHRIDGAVLADHRLLSAEVIDSLIERGVKLVAVGDRPLLRKFAISTFSHDRVRLVFELIEGLVRRGHSDLMLVDYTHPKMLSDLRLAGYELAHHFGQQAADQMILRLPNDRQQVDYGPLDSIFTRDKLPSAVIVPDECVAAEVFRRCYRHGVRVPVDLSLAACHDLTPQAHPVPLTAADSVTGLKQLMSMAAEHLEQLLDGTHRPPLHLKFETDIVWKESVIDRSAQTAR